MFKLGADALGLAGQWHPCSQATSATFSTWLGRRVWALTTAWLCSSIQTSPNKCFSAGRTQRLFLAGQTQISACSFYFFWTYIMYALCPWEKKKKKNAHSPMEQCIAALFALMVGSLASLTSCSSATPFFPCKLPFTALSPVFSPCTG